MTILEGLLKQVQKHLKGAQVFHAEDILTAIREHNLVYADEIKMDETTLVLVFEDTEVWFNLTWRQDGPRQTLINIELA